ncbi:hypothetical protein ACTWP5_20525, partial [Streptomyces sp. 4N509B]
MMDTDAEGGGERDEQAGTVERHHQVPRQRTGEEPPGTPMPLTPPTPPTPPSGPAVEPVEPTAPAPPPPP